ncbi:MAG: WYL domain-containing protein [Cyanobacterium sp. T60_A2020_053]|nr:WYL domain-containing protein [Cyanobacterium sp. T60_A2020_053]
MISYILIGCPSSGKSTLAKHIIKQDSNYQIISTDSIRKQLFGDENIQRDWQLIEAEIFKQIDSYIQVGKPIIYDATNAQRWWRMTLLEKLAEYENVNWIGWYLKTPLNVCLDWNKKRSRQVPDDVITNLYQSLRNFPPLPAEGFLAVYDIPFKDGKLEVNEFNNQLSKLNRVKVNRTNRTANSKIQFHPYSRLLDFDRIFHLISLIIKYPNLGNLSKSNPELITEILGEETKFACEIEEICAILAKKISPIYAQPEAIKQDLIWLEKMGIIHLQNYELLPDIEIVNIDDLVTHPYSDIEPFTRLIKTIHFIIHHPLIYKKKEGCLQSLVQAMQDEQIIHINCGDSIRKDIEKVLKPFGIFPDFTMKKGYFIGTGILSQTDLIKVFRLLEAQANSLSDPVALSIYETFKNRLGDAKIAHPESYPVRAIYNKNIVDLNSISNDSLAKKIDVLEGAIASGHLLELNRFSGSAKFSQTTTNNNYFLAYPLQIVFHNIGWYLAYEYAEGIDKGLFKFERLDRLFLGRKTDKLRDVKQQVNALNKLQELYQASGGIFLGNNVKWQKEYLDKKQRSKAEITIELWFNDYIFKFISEGTNRFPLQQMKMSPPLHKTNHKKPPFTLKKTEDKNYPNRFQVKLPLWSLEDIDLLRWIVGFGGQVKVINPPELVNKVKKLGEDISLLYYGHRNY